MSENSQTNFADWYFGGFCNWRPRWGVIPRARLKNALKASVSLWSNGHENIPRETCEDCVCWRETATCVQVQLNSPPPPKSCRAPLAHNCCPILFFDHIGITLPRLNASEDTPQKQSDAQGLLALT